MFDYARTTALVTGASSGIGEAFAEALAQRGASVVLVARTTGRLDALADRLRVAHGVQATVISADLGDPAAPAMIHDACVAQKIAVNLLVNNAGFALSGDFLGHELQREQDQIAVNATAPMMLCRLFAGEMRPFGKNAGIINIASSAAFQPLAFAAVYAATKSFLLMFSQALGHELKEHGTRVLVVCPGPVRTAFFDKIGSRLTQKEMDDPASIVAEALVAFERGKAVIIPGRIGIRLQALGARFLPRSMLVSVSAGISRKIMMAGA